MATMLVDLQQVQSYSRPGLAWEYQWVNFRRTRPSAVAMGNSRCVAYARDRTVVRQPRWQDKKYNWGSATAEFRFDETLNDPDPTPEGAREGYRVASVRPIGVHGCDDGFDR